MMTRDEIDNYFTYHAPKEGDRERFFEIREAGKALAHAIRLNTPDCADQSAAIRKVREAVMTANAAIACRKG